MNTKETLALKMYEKGLRVETIAELLGTDPSLVANTLIDAGYTPSYTDIYASAGGSQNRYAQMLAGVLRFKDMAAAEASATRLDELYGEFETLQDRRGMHQCMVLALTGKSRAEGIGKWKESRVFADWLRARL